MSARHGVYLGRIGVRGDTMKEGDMVRFAKWEELSADVIQNSKNWHRVPKEHIGILIEHDKLMGSVHILCDGTIFRVRPVFVEKAGKRDFNDRKVSAV